MKLSFLKLSSASLAVIIATAVFFGSLFFGIQQGKTTAQSESLYNQVRELNKGLDNFFLDQNRFPDSEEFSDANILLTYFSGLPQNQPLTSACEQNFIYKRLELTGYQLNFCLPSNFGNYKQGWNVITTNK